jgi:Ca-activated chloride channel family protein
LRSKDYKGAADLFGKLKDSDGQYNRGNALAHEGDLQGALNAYDAALKMDPENRDARHNREVVANAMKHQPPKSGSSKDQGKQGQDKQGQSGGQGNKGQEGKNGDKGQSGKQRDKKRDKGQQGNSKDQETKGNSGSHESEGKEGQPNDGEGQGGSPLQSPASNPQQPGSAEGEAALQSAVSSAQGERSEQQLSEDQWLRNIPDDPGGLLRRKFLIEHMLRQQ